MKHTTRSAIVMMRMALGLIASALLAAGPAFPAHAHSWYPADCCSGEDCAPVEALAWVTPADAEQPRLVVTTARGQAIIPYGFPVKPSQDSRMHVCMMYDHFGEMTVLCVFMPANM